MAKKKTVANTANDPTVEFVEIQLQGKTWKLAYDFNAIAEAEKLTGCNLLQGVSGVLYTTMTAQQLRALLYAAMCKAHPKVTLEEVGTLIPILSMADIQRALLKTWGIS